MSHFTYFWTGVLKTLLSHLTPTPQVCLIAKLFIRINLPNFEAKMVYLGISGLEV